MQVGARAWAKNDKVRQKLADCYDGMQREERIRDMRDVWRAEVARKTGGSSPRSGSGPVSAAWLRKVEGGIEC
jgi:hypothetical protein